MSTRKPSSRKIRLVKKTKQTSPVPAWIILKTKRSVRTNPKRRAWRTTDTEVGWVSYPEGVHTINLGKVLLSQRQHRAVRAINMIKEYAARHTHADRVKIDEELAHQIWARGVRRPPRKVTVELIQDGSDILVTSYKEEEPVQEAEALPTPKETAPPATVPDS